MEGEYELQFEVQVGEDANATGTDTVTVMVTSENLAPVVKADDNRTVLVASSVSLNGTQTFDPNGDSLTYEWSVVSAPEGSKLTDEAIAGRTFAGPTSKLKGPNYYLFFAGAMLVAGLVFIPVARWYQPKEYLQDEAEEDEAVPDKA